MTSYYYLLSGLPSLSASGPCPISYGEFLSQCRGNIGTKEWEFLSRLSLDGKGNALTAEWAETYAAYADLLAAARRRRKDGQPAPAAQPTLLSRAVDAAVLDTDPLTAEKTLIAYLFSEIDEWIGTHAFDLRALTGYALKLQLCERQSSFRQEEGKEELTRVVASLEEAIARMEQEG